MLNLDIVRLVCEFSSWPPEDGFSALSESSEEIEYLLDFWRCEILGFYGESILTNDEEILLKEILETEDNSVYFQIVSEYIRWVLRHLQWGDPKDEMIFFEWCETTEGGDEILKKWHQKSEYFSSMLPHYISSLRAIISGGSAL